MEQAIMVELTKAQTWARTVVDAMNYEGVPHPAFTRATQTVATAAAQLDTLHASSAAEVDKVYHQLMDILSVAATQQVEISLQCWAKG
jgi:hypothetical protein